MVLGGSKQTCMSLVSRKTGDSLCDLPLEIIHHECWFFSELGKEGFGQFRKAKQDCISF